jgi:uncharacterized protein
LHIFEPRYRQLMGDALDDDRMISMALLRPGWEDHPKDPPIHPMVCVGRVTQEERLSDGRYNLLLQGLCRARVFEELETAKPYRVARVELCPDRIVKSDGLERTLRRDLGAAATPYFSAHPPAMAQLRRLLESPLPLGSLTDIFCFALPLEVEEKQLLLEAVCVEARVQMLLRTLEGRTPPATTKKPPRREFPPEFSSN